MQTVCLDDQEFQVPASYSAVRLLGAGAYGTVAEFKDASGKGLAVKKIYNIFGDRSQNVVEAKRSLREIKLLRHLRHENVIELVDVMTPPAPVLEDVYLVLGLMETDLHHVIQSSQDLTDDHVLFFSYQVMRALKYLHSASVVHRDLKPRNLLVNSDCDLRICDFGLARVISDKLVTAQQQESTSQHNQSPDDDAASQSDGEAPMVPTLTAHDVVTLWWRAPEVILSESYSFGVDMFSVGCILAEMMGRRALFKSASEGAHLKKIMQVVGTPSAEDLKDIVMTEDSSEDLLAAMEQVQASGSSFYESGRTQWSQVYPNVDPARWRPEVINLLETMLAFSPSKRPSTVDVLAHPFFEDMHDPSDEPVCEQEIDWEFDSMPLTVENVRNALYRECKPLDEEPATMKRLPSTKRSSVTLNEDLSDPTFFTQLGGKAR